MSFFFFDWFNKFSYLNTATATASIAKPQIVGDSVETLDGLPEGEEDLEDGEEFWQTSIGRFKFSIDTLPQPLQYIHQVLTVN